MGIRYSRGHIDHHLSSHQEKAYPIPSFLLLVNSSIAQFDTKQQLLLSLDPLSWTINEVLLWLEMVKHLHIFAGDSYLK